MSVEGALQAIDQAKSLGYRIRSVKLTITCVDGSSMDRIYINNRGDFSALSSNTILTWFKHWMTCVNKEDLSIASFKYDLDYFSNSEECPWDLEEAQYGQIKKDEPKEKSFVLIAVTSGGEPGWWEQVDTKLYNRSGGRCDLLQHMQIFMRAKFPDWESLFMNPDVQKINKTVAQDYILGNENHKQGWIDEKGKWYPVRYGDHEHFLYMYFAMTEPEAMKKGFLRVRDIGFFQSEKKPNQKQIDTMFDLGMDIKRYLED